jgi:hypothetical protein
LAPHEYERLPEDLVLHGHLPAEQPLELAYPFLEPAERSAVDTTSSSAQTASRLPFESQPLPAKYQARRKPLAAGPVEMGCSSDFIVKPPCGTRANPPYSRRRRKWGGGSSISI